ncbi:DHS-like NAD/FAD-binding domain-containing protein [Neurospora crassa]|nr:DHS-like NAD/FAD-binding domain-containing protein [Neurospora crassa]
MAHTAHKNPKKEMFEAPEVIDRKAKVLADLIRKSKHFVVFTGAGVSTSAGIPDFRGPEGVWTLMAQGRQATKKSVDVLQAIPTKTHMALVELQERGILKGLISQNCDGLHRRSGIRADMISELHGNTNIEHCKNCGKEFLRADFYAVAPDNRPLHDHRTGRKCPICLTQPLHDTIIHFSEDLPLGPWSRAEAHCEKADLCLVLGSSLTVTPANELPQLVGERAAAQRKKQQTQQPDTDLVICNLQDTDLDYLCPSPDHRIYARADDLMERVMHYLSLPVPNFYVRRRLIVGTDVDPNPAGGRHVVTVKGVDEDNSTPASFLRTVKLVTAGGRPRIVKTEPFVLGWRGKIGEMEEEQNGSLAECRADEVRVKSETLTLGLEFMGNYGEPSFELQHTVRVSMPDNESDPETSQHRQVASTVYELVYNPRNGTWVGSLYM